MKKWNLIYSSQKLVVSSQKLLNILLENRGLKTKKEKEEFLNPNLSKVTLSSVGIDKSQVSKALKRIERAIRNKEQIIIFGDYDVDGICGSAILWETLNSFGANVLPYIPSRFEEGYGLSLTGISNIKNKISNIKLIITVDNGIVANEAVDFAKSLGIDVIVTDHHVPSEKLPKAHSIIHTTAICGAGVAYLLSQAISNFQFPISKKILNTKYKIPDTHLELVCLATIADLVPLKGANRVFVHFGLKSLQNTRRVGLLELLRLAGIEKENVGVYEIGYIIAPRLNAMGRLESAMDSLRLICTKDVQRAQKLAKSLSDTNLQRQEFTINALNHAKEKTKENALKNLIFIADKSYQEGVVGLVAGRITEEFYLPSIIVSKGKKYSKASARSVKGFNIVEFLRQAEDLMVNMGGHPMAAGFTVETAKLEILEKRLHSLAEKLIDRNSLQRQLNIDLEIPAGLITFDVYNLTRKLAPFGMANPEPTFLTKDLIVEGLRIIGKDGKHLKLQLKHKIRSDLDIASNEGRTLTGIYFGAGDSHNLKIGDRVDVIYTLDVNEWNGSKKLQLKIKDVRKN
ncbi:MAG: single-stranded-DNA-specific exonuclease RecJ [Candidatus Levybacteria bacterium CG10_big_fil_rev_8_21_14_0_10_35_13]|nr:MAG: single-stranded-DNA-specific exonuclease RecJ [Candidatus Levybacteria bacterium CG10_big_fil_rev_8_21_14_0_10_35_13]